MSGHSKWATIKHAKGIADAKRGKLFTKFIKEISIAARMGGGDPNSNPRLRTAIIKARASNMPKDNIERAIKKGTGELGGATYEELVYEGYGAGGVAVLVEVLTDNKNRAAADVRNIFNKSGGNLGVSGSVARMFQRKGTIEFDAEKVSEDELMEVLLKQVQTISLMKMVSLLLQQQQMHSLQLLMLLQKKVLNHFLVK